MLFPDPVGPQINDHSIGKPQKPPVLLQEVGAHPELVQAEQREALVEQPENGHLPGHAVADSGADVHLPVLDVHGELAVLRPPPLGDVHARHDLEPRDYREVQLQRQAHDVVQDTVDSEPDAEAGLGGLDVYV